MSAKGNSNSDKEPTKMRPDHSKIARYLMMKYRFATMVDNGEMYVYDKNTGLYKPRGDIVIEQEVQGVLITYGHSQESTTGFINRVKDFIRRETYIERDRFNARDDLLVVRNGVLDLSDPTAPILGPFSPDYLFTMGLGIDYHPRVICPKILRFLYQVADGPTVELLLEIFGWCLDFNSGIQAWVLLWGPSHTGKSTFLSLLRAFLGKDNCSAVTLQQLVDNRFAIADLYGKWANIFADVPAASFRTTSILKALTGGDMIRAEKKNKDPFYFINRAKLLFSANDAPPVKEDTEAFWRRVILIDFSYRIDPSKVVLNYWKELATDSELSGLLNLALERRARIRKRGRLSYSLTPAETRERYMLRSDSIGMFIEEQCILDQDDWGAAEIGKDELYQAYCSYCRSRHIMPATKIKFGRSLKEHLGRQISEGQDKNHRNVWRGITVKS